MIPTAQAEEIKNVLTNTCIFGSGEIVYRKTIGH